MKFIERFKKDKVYRFKAVLIFIAIVLIAGNVPDSKKEAEHWTPQPQCDIANTEGPPYVTCDNWNYLNGKCMLQSSIGTLEQEARISCLGYRCGIGVQVDSSGIETFDTYGCFSCVPVGLRTTSKDKCCSELAEPSSYFDDYDFICVSGGNPDNPNLPDPSGQCTQDYQRSFASILDSFEWSSKMTCKSQFFMVAFGGGLIAFTFIMSAL